MAERATPRPVDSRTVALDGLSLTIARSALRGRALVTVSQNGRVVAVGKANREQLGEIVDAASARRVAMAGPRKEEP